MWRAMYHEFRRWAKFTGKHPPTYRKTEVTLETDRIWIIRRTRTSRGWCGECGREVDLIRAGEAAAIAGRIQLPLSADDSEQAWHRVEGADGSMLICLPSVVGRD